MSLLGDAVAGQIESLTLTWAIVSGPGPLFRTWAVIMPGSRTNRSMVRFSIGAGTSRSRLPMVASTSAISTPSRRIGPRSVLSAVFNLEHSYPAELGKFRLVGVKEIPPGELV